MRYKFRGKRVDNGKWVYWDVYGRYAKEFHRQHSPSHWIVRHDDIVEETVGQFTNLTDKNGAEVYEGDIVKHKQYVEWGNLSEHKGEIAISPRKGVMVGADSIGKDVEVIGNIHDNPSLLESEGK